MGRRQFIRSASSTTAALASLMVLGPISSACGGGAPSTTKRLTPTTLTSEPLPWSALAKTLSGRIVVPSDPDYAISAQLYNERFDSVRPSAIAYCATAPDVQRSVEFARRFEVPLSVRSGGHSYGGYSSSSGLVIDVTQMASVVSEKESARVGAGARLIDMYAALANRGIMVPGGSCPTVGIAGLALGGGIGVLGRKYGLTCDNIRSLQLVSADSRLLTCSPSDNEDLYWASKGGGGGNFGVVTSFDLTTYALPDLSLVTLEWPWSAAAEALGAWQGWVAGAPKELWANCQLLSQSSAGTKVRVTGVFCGSTDALASEVQTLETAVGAPSYRFVGSVPFMDAMLIEAGCEGMSVDQCHLPSQNPAGVLNRSAFAVKSSFIDTALPDAAVSALVGAIDNFQSHFQGFGGAIVFDSYGGAINEVDPDATAFVHRNALADIELNVAWAASSESELVQAATNWLEQTAQSVATYSSGSYQNYIDPTLSDWEHAYYGSNLDRLMKIKLLVDPDDVFHFAQSIPV